VKYNRPSQNSFYLDSYQNKFAHASLDGEQLDLAVIGPRKEDIAAAQAILKANESSLKLAKKVWQDGHLYAPSDGIIQDRILEPGDMANSQSPIYTLALVNPVWARVYVSEQDLGKIHQGMRAQIYSDRNALTLREPLLNCLFTACNSSAKIASADEWLTMNLYS
jgi:multidrug resistance efflux pump